MLPDRCTVTFDRRTLPGEREEDVVAALRRSSTPRSRRTARPGRVTIGVDRFDSYTGAPVEARELRARLVHGSRRAASRAPRWRRSAASPGHWLFCTNGSGTAALGIPTIGYGPGDETLAHRVDEFIALDELQAGARGYATLAAALTAGG